MGSQGRILIGFRSWAGWMLGSFASQSTCWVWQNLWYNRFGLLNTRRWRSWSKSCWTNGLVLISNLFWLVIVFTFRSKYYLEQVARSFLLVLGMINIKKVYQVPILFNTGTGKHVGFSYQYCILLINCLTCWYTGVQSIIESLGERSVSLSPVLSIILIASRRKSIMFI